MRLYNNLEEYLEGQRYALELVRTANLPDMGVVLKVLASPSGESAQANLATYSVTHEVDKLEVDCLGVVGDRHYRSYAQSTGRERDIVPKGTLIREQRHVFAVSLADCRRLSERLGVEVTPELLGANLVIGREDGQEYSLSALPPDTYLLFADAHAEVLPKPPIAALVRYAQQEGCGVTGNALAVHYDDKSLTSRFRDVSKTNRGIVCRVDFPTPENKAVLEAGQRVFFKYSTGVAP
ncbi:MAG: hypothetical protein Q7R96_06425 [Nanoarchaeota archaeon]|nr:hypothetical protein [Nanoarchaeota archaeon]